MNFLFSKLKLESKAKITQSQPMEDRLALELKELEREWEGKLGREKGLSSQRANEKLLEELEDVSLSWEMIIEKERGKEMRALRANIFLFFSLFCFVLILLALLLIAELDPVPDGVIVRLSVEVFCF